MSILLWILQLLLAVHTAIGAFWKFSHPAKAVPSLAALPQGVWLGLGVIDLLCSAALVLPLFLKSWTQVASIAAILIASEMVIFSGLHLRSGAAEHGHLIYWLVVAVLCAGIAYGRWSPKSVWAGDA